METADELRKLIEEYRNCLLKANGAAMVTFILERIDEAERKLSALETGEAPRDKAADPRPKPPSDC